MLIQFDDGIWLGFIIASFTRYSFSASLESLILKGDKKPKLAGWMYIIGGVLIGVLTIGTRICTGYSLFDCGNYVPCKKTTNRAPGISIILKRDHLGDRIIYPAPFY